MAYLGLRFRAFTGAYSLRQEWDRFCSESEIARSLSMHVARDAFGATAAVILFAILDEKCRGLLHAAAFVKQDLWVKAHLTPLVPEAYATDSPEVRGVIVEERVSNTYLRTLTALLSFSLTALALQAMGFRLGRILLLAIAVLTVIGIFSFLLLGLQAFMFFDYARIVRVPLIQVIENARGATGRLAKDISIQAHFQRPVDSTAK